MQNELIIKAFQEAGLNFPEGEWDMERLASTLSESDSFKLLMQKQFDRGYDLGKKAGEKIGG